MSVKELAAAMEKDTSHVFECLTYIKVSKKVKKADAMLDFQVINEVCNKSGVRPQIISRPSTHKKIEGLFFFFFWITYLR